MQQPKKKLRNAKKQVGSKFYSINEAIDIIKKTKLVKFDETIDIVIRLNINYKKSNEHVRGTVILPYGIGKNIKVAVICMEDQWQTATDAGADLVGGMSIIEDIKANKINFDKCITTPDMMDMISNVAKILGPKGLMPNPKSGTLTSDIRSAVKNVKSGQIEFKTEKAGIIHAGIGKVSFLKENLVSNINAFIAAIKKHKPISIKGNFLKSMYLSSTMGPAIKISSTSYLS